jgi:hypothetical protein
MLKMPQPPTHRHEFLAQYNNWPRIGSTEKSLSCASIPEALNKAGSSSFRFRIVEMMWTSRPDGVATGRIIYASPSYWISGRVVILDDHGVPKAMDTATRLLYDIGRGDVVVGGTPPYIELLRYY